MCLRAAFWGCNRGASAYGARCANTACSLWKTGANGLFSSLFDRFQLSIPMLKLFASATRSASHFWLLWLDLWLLFCGATLLDGWMTVMDRIHATKIPRLKHFQSVFNTAAIGKVVYICAKKCVVCLNVQFGLLVVEISLLTFFGWCFAGIFAHKLKAMPFHQ